MTAVVTHNLKRRLTGLFNTNVSGGKYYIGFSRSEYWDSADTAPTPVASVEEERKFRQSLQAMKKVDAWSFVVPRSNWVTGTTYAQYDDTQVGYPSPNYYVMNDNHHVYICYRTGRDDDGNTVASTIQPTGSNNEAFETSDGYVWKFIYTISALNANQFLSANYMPVPNFLSEEPDSDASGIDLKRWEIQQNANPQITSIVVTDGGSGYTSRPTVTITGDGDVATAVATIDSDTGTVAKIEFENDSSTLAYPTGYNYADVSITGGGGTGAEARPVLSMPQGFGYNAADDVKASATMIHCKVDGDEEDFIVLQDFRQVGLVYAPEDYDGNEITADTVNALKSLTLSSTTVAFNNDKTIVGGTSGTRAYVDEVDSDTIYFHQNEDTGYGDFQVGENLTESDGAGEGVIGSIIDSAEVDPFTGRILYIDNRSAIERTVNQTEDIKIVLQL